MALAELTVQDLRCIDNAELNLSPGTTLLYGANGAGKTSILEAIYLLGRGRSFRTRLNERLIRHGQGLCRVVGKVTYPLGSHALGVEVRKGGDHRSATAGRLNGSSIRSLSELALAFPTQIIDPDAHKLIEDSSIRRRRWLDWAAAVTLSLCQLEFLKHEHDLHPTVLLDDPSAELDHSRLERFIRRVRRLDTQIVVTALEKDFRLFGEPENLFHVEQGGVFRV
jgi:recombinational DNA repair ATPase RecF